MLLLTFENCGRARMAMALARPKQRADWPGAEAEAVIRVVVKDRREQFRRFPDLTEDDLMQAAGMAARKAWPTYDPAKGRWQPFVNLVARRTLINLWVSRTKEEKRKNALVRPECRDADDPALLAENADYDPAILARIDEWEQSGSGQGLPGGLGGDDETLEDWVGGIYRYALRAFPRRRGKRGRNWFTPAQAVAVVLLMRKRGLSTRGAELLLRSEPELRRALQLRHVPHWTWFSRARKYATHNLRVPGAAAAPSSLE